MKTDHNRDLLINVQNTATELASHIGNQDVVLYLQQHYGVSSPDLLAASDLDQAFDDLDFMLSEQD